MIIVYAVYRVYAVSYTSGRRVERRPAQFPATEGDGVQTDGDIMTKLTPEKRLMAHAELTQAITQAIVTALATGMAREDVAAAVTRVVELLEQEDD